MFFHRHGCSPNEYQFMPRFGGFRGGPFGGSGPFGGGGHRGGGTRMGRVLRDGDLRLVALALLETGPRHGYDIIKALEERSGGFYSPSPGVVYPTLTFLEEAGYVTSAAEGNKKVYTITDTGREFLNANRAETDAVLETLARIGSKVGKLRDWFDWTDSGPGQDRPREEAAGTMGELDKARRRLRALIIAATEGTTADQDRVAKILDRASDEILGKKEG